MSRRKCSVVGNRPSDTFRLSRYSIGSNELRPSVPVVIIVFRLIEKRLTPDKSPPKFAPTSRVQSYARTRRNSRSAYEFRRPPGVAGTICFVTVTKVVAYIREPRTRFPDTIKSVSVSPCTRFMVRRAD